MLHLTSYVVLSDTTFIKAKCKGDVHCKGHTFAKDSLGWHQQERDVLLNKFYWERVDPIMTGDLEKMLEAAEIFHLGKKP